MATVETQGIQTSQRRMHRFQLPGGGELTIKRGPYGWGGWDVWVIDQNGNPLAQRAFNLESSALTYATRWLEWE